MKISNWKTVARTIKKAFLTSLAGKNGFQLDLCGHKFRVAYEARDWTVDRDYFLLQRLAREKASILDIGANIGITSLIMANSMQAGGTIYAFEASEDACRLAMENIALNGLEKNIKVINSLVSEKSGQSLAFYWDYSSGGASTLAGYLNHHDAIHKTTVSVDDFCSTQSIRPELIKVDVEGAELSVLRGMEHVMAVCRPVVALELHGWEKMPVTENANVILQYLRTVSYKMIYLRTKTEVQNANVFSDRGRCHVLLLPQDSSTLSLLNNFDTTSL